MKIEDVSGIGFTTRRAAKEEGDSSVGDSVFGEVIVDGQCVHAVVAEVFAHCGSGERCEVLHGVRVGCGGDDDDCVFEGVVFAESFNDTGDVGHFLTDGDIDAVDLVFFIAVLIQLGLVDDGVDADGGFSGLSVADDEFPLASTDGDHGVNGLDSGLEGFGDGLSVDNAGAVGFDQSELFGGDGSEVVDRLT